MYYAGIYCDDLMEACRAVIIEKVLRYARREYHVMDIRSIRMESWVKDVKSLYDDPGFLRKKKVFSQDRRPPKNTFTPPLLIVCTKNGEPDRVQTLRDSGIPVEGLSLRDEPGWVREEPKILRFGSNLFVGRDDLGKLDKVLASPFMVWPEDGNTDMVELKDEIARCTEYKRLHGFFPDDLSGLLFSLILAVWHCETIRPVKRYGG